MPLAGARWPCKPVIFRAVYLPIDAICQAHYGYTQGAVEAVLEANRWLADKPTVLAAGLEITLPALGEPPAREPVRLWD